MKHGLFKPSSLEEGKHGVVGDCNGISMEVRYAEETPVFARKILKLLGKGAYILDYGCGVGRIAKEIFKQNTGVYITGLDASEEMRKLAVENVSSDQFRTMDPRDFIEEGFDLVYLVYVLQHIPAIEIREALQRIHFALKDDGILFYCSSDYRMAIRHDQGGFFDDRFLGVNLQEELSRYFELVGPAFTDEELNQNKVVKTMITGGNGGLPHPALIYRKKKIEGPIYNAKLEDLEHTIIKEAEKIASKTTQKLVLVQKQSPGDIMMATVALRDLHLTYPGEYLTDMRSPAMDIFKNNPYVKPIPSCENEEQIIEELKADDKHAPIKRGDVLYCNLHYPLVHESGALGVHFADAMTKFLSEQLGRPIKRTGLRPEIYLDFNEENWPSPAVVDMGYQGNYWVINAGIKSDFTLKQYPFYQEVVDILKGKVQFIQIGQAEHIHGALKGVINMIGKTDMRKLFRLINKADGVLTCVSFPMHVTASLKRPCVVVAGGREAKRWEEYPDHMYLALNGTLPCARYDGCWRSKSEDCLNVVDGVPLCMRLIRPEDIARAIDLYYLGGVLNRGY